MTDRAADWNEKASFMRDVGATEATFDTSGKLLSLKLGPPPASPPDKQDEDSDEEAQQREERHRPLPFRAVGGLIPRAKSDE